MGVEADRPGPLQRRHEAGQLGLGEMAPPLVQVVQLPEPDDPPPLPPLPGLAGSGRRRRIPLQHGDLVPVPGQQDRRGHTVHACSP